MESGDADDGQTPALSSGRPGGRSEARIAILGAGYVGLVTGACLATTGADVTCADTNAARTQAIMRMEAPFHELGLDQLLRRTVGAGLRATTDLEEAVRRADVVMIAVGTPTSEGRIDLTQVRDACQQIGPLLKLASDYPVVVVKSTVVPGTTDGIIVPLLEEASGLRVGRDFAVAVNPEFLTEGTAVDDFLRPDRIVIGALDDRAAGIVADLYRGLTGVRHVVTNPATAEMIKYASNTLLATLISFSNEIADLGAAVGGVDVEDVMRGVHSSRYLSLPDGRPAPIVEFLRAGCGYGGSCLPKDTRALVALGEDLGRPMMLLRAVDEVNRERPGVLVDIVERATEGLAGRRVAVLGLAFKPGTDDVRESPAFAVIDGLLARGARIVAHDPVAIDATRRTLGAVAVTYEPDLASALADVDAAVIVTSWPEYAGVPELLAAMPRPPVIVDGRRMLDRGSVPHYEGVGL